MLRKFLDAWRLDPDCGTSNKRERDAWIANALAQIPANSRILDAGAGELQYQPQCHHLDYVSQDFGEYNGKGDGSGLQIGAWDQSRIDIVSDITAIPEPDASFDAILCIEVLEHLPAPVEALREFSRLLRTGGRLIVTAPFASLTHFAPYHFYSGFNSYFYTEWLHAVGLKPLELTPNGNYFEYIAQELRRIESVGEKYSSAAPRMGRSARSLQRFAMNILLRQLAGLAKRDEGSSELLCYGYHVVAEKINTESGESVLES